MANSTRIPFLNYSSSIEPSSKRLNLPFQVGGKFRYPLCGAFQLTGRSSA